MKPLIALIVLGFAGYGGYMFWQQRAKPQPQAVKPLDEEPPAPAATPTPAPAAPTPAPEIAKPKDEPKPVAQIPEKRLAPEGVFYFVKAFSLTTDSGIRGVRLGTPVRLIKDAGTTMRVTDGRDEFDVQKDYLTNDLGYVEKMMAQIGARQAANEQRQSTEKAMSSANAEREAAESAAIVQSVQQGNEAARAATEARAQRIAALRTEIAQTEASKLYVPVGITKQKHIDSQNERIRQLQLELGRLGVGGAALERR